MTTLLGTGLRFGELAGLRRRRGGCPDRRGTWVVTAGAPATPVPSASEPAATQATADAPATGMLMRSRARGWGPAPIDLVTPVLFPAISVGVILLLMTPTTSRDFRSSRQPLAGTNGR
jgi:hypothetical protein